MPPTKLNYELCELCSTLYPNLTEVSELVQSGANVNCEAEKELEDGLFEGMTPLMIASRRTDDHNLIHLLLQLGADIHMEDWRGWTPLVIAVQNNNNDKVISSLINSGADVNKLAGKFSTRSPISFAAGRTLNPNVITLLVDAGANINDVDSIGVTPLMSAVMGNLQGRPAEGNVEIVIPHNNLSVIDQLLYLGADVNIAPDDGHSCLMFASGSHEHVDRDTPMAPPPLLPKPKLLSTLLNAGADALAKNSGGKNAWDFASKSQLLSGTDALHQLHVATHLNQS